MKKIILFLLLLILLSVGIGYLTLKGKIPFISERIFKQVDLGINESPEVIYTYYDEIGFVNNLEGDTPQSGELIFEGGIDLDHTFTQQEINSWFSAWEESWTGIPFKNLQVKLNSDGTVEASSLISIQEAESIGKTLGYSQEEIDKAKSYLEYIPDPLPLYAKGTISITQDDVQIDMSNFKVANFNVPSTITSGVAWIVEDVIEKARNMSDETTINSATVTSEGVKFIGRVPASVSIKE